MKKLSLIVILILVSVALVFGQEKERKFSVLTNPIFLFASFTSLGFTDEYDLIMDLEGQYKINDLLNISLTASFQISNNSEEEREAFQINFKPMLIFRPIRTGLRGFYTGIYSIVGWNSYKNRWDEISSTEFGLGASVGYKWIFKSGFSMQAGTGIGKTWYFNGEKSDFFDINCDGRISTSRLDVYLIDFKMGYSF